VAEGALPLVLAMAPFRELVGTPGPWRVGRPPSDRSATPP